MQANALDRAQLFIDQDRWIDAERELKLYLGQEPEDPDAHRMLALCLLQTNRRKEGLFEAQKAVALEPDNPWAHYVVAYAHQVLRKYKKAEEAISEALRRDPEEPDFYALLSGLQAIQAKPRQSLETAEAGLSIDPTHEECLNLRAQALSILGRSHEAIASGHEALAQNPVSDSTHTHLGWANLRGGQRESALQHLKEALRLNPNDEYAREGLLEALRTGFWPYRMIFTAYGYVHRLPRQLQWLPGIALWLIFRTSARFLRQNPSYTPVLAPFVFVIGAFYFLYFVGRPLANITLLFTPLGRLALGPTQRRETWVSFAFLAAGLVLLLIDGVSALQTGAGGAFFLLAFLLMGLPNGRCSSERTQSILFWSVAVVFGLLASLVTVGGLIDRPE
ncbi:MAG TPA: tetratricopeptide repeat protein [Fimbriimonas sp.]